MKIQRNGEQPAFFGTDAWFTGDVRLDFNFAPGGDSRLSSGLVNFTPGARTRWHTHPVGQLLIVTAGVGHIQLDGQPIQEIRAGDLVWFEAGEKHWHGATANTAMSHIAIQEAVNGTPVEWLEPVTDEQFGK